VAGHALVPTAAAGLRHVDARQQQREVRAAHLDRARRRVCWPRKRALLEPLVKDPEARAIPREDLEPVPAAIPKQKEMARERIEREALPHQRASPSIDRRKSVAPVAR
jgi:hypothetical protein